jgi:hypothetical protein
MSNEPFVILIDLDNTLQGNILPQLSEYNLHQHLIRNTREYNRMNKNVGKDLTDDFKHGLLRPKFRKFVKKITTIVPNVEFFLYTASEDSWAKYIIKILERSIDFKFSTLVLTRNHCLLDNKEGRYMKRIELVTPLIAHKLKSKYPSIITPKKHKFKNIILIDNNVVLYEDEMNHLIKCNDFDGIHIIDTLRNVPPHIVKIFYKLISQHLYDYTPSSLIEFYSFHYKYLKDSINTHELKMKSNKDTTICWKEIMRSINKKLK